MQQCFFLKLLMALEALAAGMWKLKSIGLHKRKVVSQSPPIFRGKLAVGFRGCVIMCPPKKTLDSNFLNSVNFNYLQFIVSQLNIIWPSGIVNQTLTPPTKKCWVIWKVIYHYFFGICIRIQPSNWWRFQDLKLQVFFSSNKKLPVLQTTGPFKEVNVNWRRPIQKLLVAFRRGWQMVEICQRFVIFISKIGEIF